MINSRLYSEKAYVLARGFVRRALEIPLGGLEEEIKWFYHTHGRLVKVLRESRALIEKSRQEPIPSKEVLEKDRAMDVANPRLTIGGIILLERTLGKLQSLLDAHTSQA
jgi:ubiquitin-conjugating enzyme E2 O